MALLEKHQKKHEIKESRNSTEIESLKINITGDEYFEAYVKDEICPVKTEEDEETENKITSYVCPISSCVFLTAVLTEKIITDHIITKHGDIDFKEWNFLPLH